VIAICVGVELFASVFAVIPRLERHMIQMAGKYDAYFPEITIQDGHASIKEKQPYFIENVRDSRLVLVIDTTVSSYEDASRYLKNNPYGAVLTRSAIVNKELDQIEVVSLKRVPDMVINSDNIVKAIERLRPIVMTWGLAVLALCFVVTKLLQVLTLAAIPFLGVRLFRGSITFEEAFRLTGVCMVAPVGINFFLGFSEMGMLNMLIMYYAVFVTTLIIVTRDYVREIQQIG